MTTVTLGKTGITVNKNGFGALPIQRITKEEAAKLLRKAYDGGITYFDTARAYSDSEEKIGYALSDVRNHIYLATKTAATTAEGFWKDLETSLRLLKTDCIDVYQFHNPAVCPKPGDESGLYDAALKAREQGKIRFISITNHRLAVANEAVDSGLYATLQFPFCYLCSEKDHELDEFLSYIDNPPVMDDEIRTLIENDRKQLFGSFCRACGYCMPCPAGIEINTCARMSLLLRRSPSELQLTPEVQAKMMKIKDCLHCGHCMSKCPYGLNTPELLQRNLKDYEEVLAGKEILPGNF